MFIIPSTLPEDAINAYSRFIELACGRIFGINFHNGLYYIAEADSRADALAIGKKLDDKVIKVMRDKHLRAQLNNKPT